MNDSRVKLRIAALTGLLGVGLGAFGAHALQGHLEKSGFLETWQTAVFYHLIHAVVILVLALVSPQRLRSAYWCIFCGIVLFCGSLYFLALSGLTVIGAITPLGGVALLLGWGLIFIRAPYV
jgi:uncharacterized membrane protein YgdD (TMEM256/DUF423 family)